MHSILLVVKKPENAGHEGQQAWLAFQAAIEDNLNNNAEAPEGLVQKLSENVLLFDANTAFGIFVTLASKIQNAGFSYQVLFFEEPPQWVKYAS